MFGRNMDPEKVRTGVMYHRDSHLYDDNPVDPDWDHLAKRWGTGVFEWRRQILLDLGYSWDESNSDALIDSEFEDIPAIQEWFSSVLLHGNWIQGSDGLWDPDPQGEWAALERVEDGTLQVVWSHHKMLCVFCSPCYPDQGDLDTPSGQVPALDGPTTWAYCLPPELCQDDWASKPYICHL